LRACLSSLSGRRSRFGRAIPRSHCKDKTINLLANTSSASLLTTNRSDLRARNARQRHALPLAWRPAPRSVPQEAGSCCKPAIERGRVRVAGALKAEKPLKKFNTSGAAACRLAPKLRSQNGGPADDSDRSRGPRRTILLLFARNGTSYCPVCADRLRGGAPIASLCLPARQQHNLRRTHSPASGLPLLAMWGVR